MDETLRNLTLSLHDIGAVKFGEFRLKSGVLSPFYIDLRLIISYPKLLQQIADAIWKTVEKQQFDHICAVPYTALPIATAISLSHEIPMLMRRKEAKDYGTRKIIEGNFKPHDTCLVVEDLITSGASIFETIQPLEEVGIKVADVVVFLDREQGGKALVEKRGYRFHSVISISHLLEILRRENKISEQTIHDVHTFIRENQC